MQFKFENKSNGRYYYLILDRDMMNDFTITILRGGNYQRIISRIGFADKLCAEREIEKLCKRRISRGYELVDIRLYSTSNKC